MSWLKKFGQDVLKGFEYVLGIADKLLPFLPGAASTAEMLLPADAPLIAAGADVATEAIKFADWIKTNINDYIGAAGVAQQVQAISAFVTQGIQKWFAANFPGTAKVNDQTLFTNSISQFSQGLIDILNSVKVDLTKVSAATLGADVLTNIVKYIQWAEFTANVLLPGAQSGTSKSASIATEVQSLIAEWLQLGLAGSGSVTDQTTFEKGCTEVQNGAVGIVNSLAGNVSTVQTVKS